MNQLNLEGKLKNKEVKKESQDLSALLIPGMDASGNINYEIDTEDVILKNKYKADQRMY